MKNYWAELSLFTILALPTVSFAQYEHYSADDQMSGYDKRFNSFTNVVRDPVSTTFSTNVFQTAFTPLADRRGKLGVSEKDYLDDLKLMADSKTANNHALKEEQKTFEDAMKQIREYAQGAADSDTLRIMNERQIQIEKAHSDFVAAYSRSFDAARENEQQDRVELAKLGPKTPEGKRQASLQSKAAVSAPKPSALQACQSELADLKKAVSKQANHAQNPAQSSGTYNKVGKRTPAQSSSSYCPTCKTDSDTNRAGN